MRRIGSRSRRAWCAPTPGCRRATFVDVDTHTSVTHEAVTSTTIPVSGAISFNPEEATFGPMVAVADFNSDGNPDMAAEDNFFAVKVRLGDGAGGFGAESLYDLNLGTGRDLSRAVAEQRRIEYRGLSHTHRRRSPAVAPHRRLAATRAQ